MVSHSELFRVIHRIIDSIDQFKTADSFLKTLDYGILGITWYRILILGILMVVGYVNFNLKQFSFKKLHLK